MKVFNILFLFFYRRYLRKKSPSDAFFDAALQLPILYLAVVMPFVGILYALLGDIDEARGQTFIPVMLSGVVFYILVMTIYKKYFYKNIDLLNQKYSDNNRFVWYALCIILFIALFALFSVIWVPWYTKGIFL